MFFKRLFTSFIVLALFFTVSSAASQAVFALGEAGLPVPYASLTINGAENAQIYGGSSVRIPNDGLGNALIDVETQNVDECSLYRNSTKISNILNGRIVFTFIYITSDNDTFSLKCTGQYGSAQDTAKLTRSVVPAVDNPSPGEPIVNITANNQKDLIVTENSEVTIRWTSQNAESCSVSGTNLSGTDGEFTLNQGFDGLYMVYCYNSVGFSYDFVRVYAVPPKPATLLLNGSSSTEVEYGGGQVNLSWDAHESYKCQLAELPLNNDTVNLNDYYGNNIKGQALPTATGQMTLSVSSNKTYKLICDSPYSRVTAEASVTVKPISYEYLLNKTDQLAKSLGQSGAFLSSIQQNISLANQASNRGDKRLAEQKLEQAKTQLEKFISTGKLTDQGSVKLKNDIVALQSAQNSSSTIPIVSTLPSF